MTKQKKKNKDALYNDSWIYILLLSTLVILIDSLKTYTFMIEKTSITYAVFLIPFVYLITNYITKKFDYKKSLVAISVSGVAMVLFFVIVNFALGRNINLTNISGGFCGYVISQLINLTIYTFLLENTESPFILVFLNYLFSLIVFYMFYTLIYLNMLILDNFWTEYFMILGIQTLICLPLAYLDKKIRRGREQ